MVLVSQASASSCMSEAAVEAVNNRLLNIPDNLWSGINLPYAQE